MSETIAHPPAPVTAQQRTQFERNGYVIIPAALDVGEVTRYADGLDRVYARAQAVGRLGRRDPMHLLSAVARYPEAVGLIDHPQTFPLVWSVLGWNIHIYHSHLDVHPTARADAGHRFEWHQDGGRQNREIETSPRPRLSVKLAYFLSDVSVPGRGNTMVVPGSHTTDWIDGPPSRDVPWPDPEGAIPICAHPGDALFFDRRLWHARSRNTSPVTRKVIFFGYTYRWIAIRDDVAAVWADGLARSLSLVQRQLLGGDEDGNGDHAWGHYPGRTPLYVLLRERGLLDHDRPPLRP